MEELKKKIIEILKTVNSGKTSMPVVNKYRTLPMLILASELNNPSLEDLKKVITELKDEGKIVYLESPMAAKVSAFLNFKKPLKEEPTEVELFVFSHVKLIE